MNKSILTFNASVTNRKVVTEITSPFQIMPSTRTHLSDATIASYPVSNNENLLIHMNYITRPFGDNAIESDSRVRYSFRQYCKLIKRLNTKDLLIHMPCSLSELRNLNEGLMIIYDELCKNGVHVHLEIAPWNQEIIKHFNLTRENSLDVMRNFINQILDACAQFGDCFSIVLDTAHLFANGCDVEKQLTLFREYREHMKYAHLNGNINRMFTSDSHVPIWHDSNKIKDWELLSSELSKLNLICIAEITKLGRNYDDWEDYALGYGFDIVPFHGALSI